MDTINNPIEYKKLEIWQQMISTTWIKENFIQRVTINKYHSSYEMKHIFERSPDGFYLTNGAFKGAMLAAGFTKHDEGINWCFAITERSIRESRKERKPIDYEKVQTIIDFFDKVVCVRSKYANVADRLHLHSKNTEYNATRYQMTRKRCYFKWLCGSIVGDGVDISKEEREAILDGLFERAELV